MLKSLLAGVLAVLGLSPGAVHAEPDAVSLVARRANAFAFELYQRQAARPGNLVFSPASIHIALAMTAAGAEGETATQMNRVLGLEGGAPNPALGQLLGKLRLKDEKLGVAVSIFNGLWLSNQLDIKPDYVRQLRDGYDAHITPTDFRDTAAAVKLINDAVAKQTNDKIRDLLSPDQVDADTRLVLTNAIHFKADWANKFSKNATRDRPFHLSAAEAVQAPAMRDEQTVAYYADDAVQVCVLPYVGRTLGMAIVLPKQVDGLAAVEKQLAELPAWLGKAQKQKLAITLPTFKFESSLDLPETLQAMGMADAFDPRKANFKGMSTADELFIQAVVHKAMIDVNENGTEAAAATAVSVAVTAMPVRVEPVPFTVDRPFVIALLHQPTGAILFLARVADPRK